MSMMVDKYKNTGHRCLKKANNKSKFYSDWKLLGDFLETVCLVSCRLDLEAGQEHVCDFFLILDILHKLHHTNK